jgi:hypothetical protein
MVSSFNAMLIKCVTGRITVRLRLAALRLGCAVCNALFGGMLFGFATVGALACQPQIDDFSHAKAQRLLFARGVPGDPRCSAESRSIAPIRWQGLPPGAKRCAKPHTSEPTMGLSAFILKGFVQADADIAGAR